MKLFIDIDVSSEKSAICFLIDDDQLSLLTENSVANDIEKASLTRELTNRYWDGINVHVSFPPSMFFHEEAELKKLNTLVTIENPFQVKQFSRMFDEHKSNRNDALRIY